MKQKNLKLYLDDVRTPKSDEWIVVRSYNEFTLQIGVNGIESFEMISLDHDLGEGAMVEYYTNVKNKQTLDYSNIKEKTGMDAARFLVNLSMDTGIELPKIYVHSANPIGSQNIISYINNYLESKGLEQTCASVSIDHFIESHLELSPELRKLKWDRSKK